jgi:hypothetical protein
VTRRDNANPELELNNLDASPVDVAMSRVADQVATRTDWDALERAAETSPRVWRDLALTIRQSQELSREVLAATQDGARVHVEVDTPHSHAHENQASELPGRQSPRRLAAYGGWIAAALLVAVIGRWGALTPSNTVQSNTASLSSPMDYLANYLSSGKKEGSVLGEMPRKLLLDTTPTEDGKGVYVLFVRQIVERVKVDDLYRISVDELGNPTPVKLQAAEWEGGREKSPM